MTDQEFEILDELYFVTSFDDLNKQLNRNEEVLMGELLALINKGWVKCMSDQDYEEVLNAVEFETQYKKYNYLATKEGLHAHNSR